MLPGRLLMHGKLLSTRPEASGERLEAPGGVLATSGGILEAAGGGPEGPGGISEGPGGGREASGEIPEGSGGRPEGPGGVREGPGGARDVPGEVLEVSGGVGGSAARSRIHPAQLIARRFISRRRSAPGVPSPLRGFIFLGLPTWGFRPRLPAFAPSGRVGAGGRAGRGAGGIGRREGPGGVPPPWAGVGWERGEGRRGVAATSTEPPG